MDPIFGSLENSRPLNDWRGVIYGTLMATIPVDSSVYLCYFRRQTAGSNREFCDTVDVSCLNYRLVIKRPPNAETAASWPLKLLNVEPSLTTTALPAQRWRPPNCSLTINTCLHARTLLATCRASVHIIVSPMSICQNPQRVSEGCLLALNAYFERDVDGSFE